MLEDFYPVFVSYQVRMRHRFIRIRNKLKSVKPWATMSNPEIGCQGILSEEIKQLCKMEHRNSIWFVMNCASCGNGTCVANALWL